MMVPQNHSTPQDTPSMGWLLCLFCVGLSAFIADTIFINHADACAITAQDALGKIDVIPIRRCTWADARVRAIAIHQG